MIKFLRIIWQQLLTENKLAFPVSLSGKHAGSVNIYNFTIYIVKKILNIIIITMLFVTGMYAQDNENGKSEGKIHKVALVFGYTHIPSAFEQGNKNKSVFVPTIGVDYFVQFEKGWKLGVVLDLELSDYLVNFDRKELDREKALITGVLMGYEFDSHWSVLLGTGIEFEKNKNLFVLRSSVEYEFELDNHWGLFPSINYDFKKEYSSWSINIGISKRL